MVSVTRRAGTAFVLLLVLAACSSGGSSTPTTLRSTTTAAVVSTTSSPPTSSPPTSSPPTTRAGSTTATSIAGRGSAGTALLSGVRSARQSGFDRVVFEFEADRVPPTEVRYIPRPVRADGSGDEVTVAGSFVLGVRMFPASGADLAGPAFRLTYTGPNRLSPSGTTIVTELVRTGDFEAVLNWAVGTRSRAPFVVSTLTSPARLVIDIQG